MATNMRAAVMQHRIGWRLVYDTLTEGYATSRAEDRQMPSPFPGMNPYLEHPLEWPGFHARYIPALSDALVPILAPRYVVGLQQHVYVFDATDPGDDGQLVGLPDLSLRPGRDDGAGAVGLLTAPAPSRVFAPPRLNLMRQSYLEIRDAESNDVITVIELLSPSNKAGRDRDRYLLKWDTLLESPTHFVELDLLRGGQRSPWEQMPACDYAVTVSRWEARPVADFWPVMLRDRLPAIPVPLRNGDDPAPLDLQAVLHRVYDAAGYQYHLYRRQPDPPLSADDQAWATALITARPGIQSPA